MAILQKQHSGQLDQQQVYHSQECHGIVNEKHDRS